jgi:hypothetical protein
MAHLPLRASLSAIEEREPHLKAFAYIGRFMRGLLSPRSMKVEGAATCWGISGIIGV